jgi:hypothetical protein
MLIGRNGCSPDTSIGQAHEAAIFMRFEMCSTMSAQLLFAKGDSAPEVLTVPRSALTGLDRELTTRHAKHAARSKLRTNSRSKVLTQTSTLYLYG